MSIAGNPMQSGKTDPQFFPAGDGALVVQFGEEIDPAVNRRAARFTGRVERSGLRGIRELIPTFTERSRKKYAPQSGLCR